MNRSSLSAAAGSALFPSSFHVSASTANGLSGMVAGGIPAGLANPLHYRHESHEPDAPPSPRAAPVSAAATAAMVGQRAGAFEQTVFNVAYITSRREQINPKFSWAMTIVDDAQLLSFVFKDQLLGGLPPIFTSVVEPTKFLNSYMAFALSNVAAIIAVLSTIALIFTVIVAMHRQAKVPISVLRLLRLLCTLLFTVFSIPTAGLFLKGLHNRNGRVHIYDQAFDSARHFPLMAFDILSIVVFVPLLLVGSLLYIENSPTSTNPLARAHGRTDLLARSLRLLFVALSTFAFDFGDEGKWVFMIAVSAGLAYLTYEFAVSQPYYSARMTIVRSSFTASASASMLASMVMVGVGQPSWSWMVPAITAPVVFVIALLGVRWFIWHYFALSIRRWHRYASANSSAGGLDFTGLAHPEFGTILASTLETSSPTLPHEVGSIRFAQAPMTTQQRAHSFSGNGTTSALPSQQLQQQPAIVETRFPSMGRTMKSARFSVGGGGGGAMGARSIEAPGQSTFTTLGHGPGNNLLEGLLKGSSLEALKTVLERPGKRDRHRRRVFTSPLQVEICIRFLRLGDPTAKQISLGLQLLDCGLSQFPKDHHLQLLAATYLAAYFGPSGERAARVLMDELHRSHRNVSFGVRYLIYLRVRALRDRGEGALDLAALESLGREVRRYHVRALRGIRDLWECIRVRASPGVLVDVVASLAANQAGADQCYRRLLNRDPRNRTHLRAYAQFLACVEADPVRAQHMLEIAEEVELEETSAKAREYQPETSFPDTAPITTTFVSTTAAAAASMTTARASPVPPSPPPPPALRTDPMVSSSGPQIGGSHGVLSSLAMTPSSPLGMPVVSANSSGSSASNDDFGSDFLSRMQQPPRSPQPQRSSTLPRASSRTAANPAGTPITPASPGTRTPGSGSTKGPVLRTSQVLFAPPRPATQALSPAGGSLVTDDAGPVEPTPMLPPPGQPRGIAVPSVPGRPGSKTSGSSLSRAERARAATRRQMMERLTRPLRRVWEVAVPSVLFFGSVIGGFALCIDFFNATTDLLHRFEVSSNAIAYSVELIRQLRALVNYNALGNVAGALGAAKKMEESYASTVALLESLSQWDSQSSTQAAMTRLYWTQIISANSTDFTPVDLPPLQVLGLVVQAASIASGFKAPGVLTTDLFIATPELRLLGYNMMSILYGLEELPDVIIQDYAGSVNKSVITMFLTLALSISFFLAVSVVIFRLVLNRFFANESHTLAILSTLPPSAASALVTEMEDEIENFCEVTGDADEAGAGGAAAEVDSPSTATTRASSGSTGTRRTLRYRAALAAGWLIASTFVLSMFLVALKSSSVTVPINQMIKSSNRGFHMSVCSVFTREFFSVDTTVSDAESIRQTRSSILDLRTIHQQLTVDDRGLSQLLPALTVVPRPLSSLSGIVARPDLGFTAEMASLPLNTELSRYIEVITRLMDQVVQSKTDPTFDATNTTTTAYRTWQLSELLSNDILPRLNAIGDALQTSMANEVSFNMTLCSVMLAFALITGVALAGLYAGVALRRLRREAKTLACIMHLLPAAVVKDAPDVARFIETGGMSLEAVASGDASNMASNSSAQQAVRAHVRARSGPDQQQDDQAATASMSSRGDL
ncbi:hypothetical protein H9P43_003509 [Blastocladiella emersonii ATCC 22665]|nr:hypothetical protein H9P43_003509 [Blastocladiella emersonii ATCC 22665]